MSRKKDKLSSESKDVKHIKIDIVPHKDQRYDTIGDWYFIDDVLHITISDLGNFKYIALVAIHELIESVECSINGVTAQQVDDYDFNHKNTGSANFDDHTSAPYYKEHNDATAIEWLLSRLFKIDWRDYSYKINTL